MTYYKRYLLLLLPIFMSSAYSGTMGDDSDKGFSRLIMLSGGPAWQSAGETQTLTLQSVVQNTYYANKNTSALGSGSIFLALQRPFYKSIQGAIGVAFTGGGNARLSGEVWQDADSNYSNFNYAYNVSQFRIGLKARVVETEPLFFKAFKPYLSGEIGGGANRSTGFKLTPTIDTAVLQPPFAANTVIALTYAFGIGIQSEIMPHIQASLGYEFANWGKNNLGSSEGQSTRARLGSSNLYVNGLQFSLLYIV